MKWSVWAWVMWNRGGFRWWRATQLASASASAVVVRGEGQEPAWWTGRIKPG